MGGVKAIECMELWREMEFGDKLEVTTVLSEITPIVAFTMVFSYQLWMYVL